MSRRRDAGGSGEDFGFGESQVVVPEDQLQLTEKELDEDVSRMLYAKNPQAATEVVTFSFGENAHKKIPAGNEEHVVFHFSMDGSVLHHESDEAAAQMAYDKTIREEVYARKRDLERRAHEEGRDLAELEEMEDTSGKNQFNYSERAAQTYTNSTRTRGVTTEPPQTSSYSALFSQWDLYDKYVEKYDAMLIEAADEKDRPGLIMEQTAKRKSKKTGQELVQGPECARILRVIERMVNQNAQDEIYADFKFWEDASDQFRGNLGTLLPLWRFSDARAKRKHVTALAWNPKYPDLFAVGYGSYDFMKQGSGVIAVYTMKNIQHPEYFYTTDSGVMCLDFHPGDHGILAVGCYDGTVLVYDIRRKDPKPLFISDVRSGRHTDPVWEVRWQVGGMGSDRHFYSVSSDGRVANWVLSKNELKMEVVMTLKQASPSTGGAGGEAVAEDETSLSGLAGGCCFDFNSFEEHLFLVGTEEGTLHKCSKAYSGQYLETYEGHHMAVYAVKWNPFHPKVFLSCSADWTVKVWHHEITRPLMTFDLTNAVGDIAWAPYSSTVFAAVTSNGKALVFDLATNKHEQLCEQKIVKKARLTHVSFNDSEPVVIVGDSNGGVNSLKLSPNLRKVTPIPIPEQKKGMPPVIPPTRLEIEIGKFEHLLASADIPVPALSEEVIRELAGVPDAPAAAVVEEAE